MPKSQFIDPAEARRPGKIVFEDIPVNSYDKTVWQEKANYKKEDFMRIFRDMAVLREFEDMLGAIKTKGLYNGVTNTYEGPTHLAIGQEAAAVGQAYLLTGDDLIFGSHRNHCEILAKALSFIQKTDDDELIRIMEGFMGGRTLKAAESLYKGAGVKELAVYFMLYGTAAEIFARETGFHFGLGGSMHVFFPPFGIYPNNAIVGGSAPLATGAALFKKCNRKKGVVVANAGDGSLGCGPVWESFHMAVMDQHTKLWEDGKNHGMPILYHFNNNGYGMGGQTRGETMGYDMLARCGAGLNPEQMHAERIDGFNPLAVIDAYRRKLDILKKGGGPVLLDCVTYRFGAHSVSDAGVYREQREIDAWKEHDALITYRAALTGAGIAADAEFDGILNSAREIVKKVAGLAADPRKSPYSSFVRNPDIVESLMFSNEKVKSLGNREPETLAPKETCSRFIEIAAKERSAFYGSGGRVPPDKALSYRDALFEPIIDKFYEDASLIAYGEDVREWGGVFDVYRGLSEVIPYSRLFNSPISEAAIVGTGVGYAICGGRVIVELMNADFMGRAGDEIFNQMAKWQAMSAGMLKIPMVLRVSVGSKYGAQHSQDWVSLPAHVPGLKVLFPATPWEAKGLMASALNGTDPVVFFESQRLYDKPEEFFEGGVPRENYEIKIGDVNKIRGGGDLTILTIGATLYKAVKAADILKEKYGIKAEIINLHSIVPLNYEKIIESVKKTGRVVLASDACARGSFLNDVARNITELAFGFLKAPPVVVGAMNWITPPFEYDDDFFPQESWILDAVNEKITPLAGYVPSTGNYKPSEQMRRAKNGV